MLKYVNNPNQLFEVRQYTLTDGRAAGTRAVSVWNGGNLSVTVLPDRCLDIADVRYKGKSMAFITSPGIVNPKYFEHDGINWLRSFGGGFLTTCGLENIGVAEEENGLTMHGRIANIPCENLAVELAPDCMSARIAGTARECILFGVNLALRREFHFACGDDLITFTDTLTNRGFSKVPVCMLYHMNLGYPLIDEDASIVIPSAEVTPRTEAARQNVGRWNRLEPPTTGVEEHCFYHRLSENTYGVDNEKINTSVRINFESNGLLDRLVEWKMCGEGEYVLGMEAASSTIDGREDRRRNGSEKYIEPGQSYVNSFRITFGDLR